LKGRITGVKFLHRLAALAMTVALLGANGLAACGGWSSSASDRMACCVKSHDAEQSQSDADNCCAMSEQRSHSESPTPVSSSVSVALLTALERGPIRVAAIELDSRQSDPVPSIAGSEPLYVLHSVFLI
jgi:hypothetical protein